MHNRNISCLLSCANWVLDVYECRIVEGLPSNNENSSGDVSNLDHSVLGGGMPSNMMDLSTTKKIMTIVSIFYIFS